jgi:hypothetical protein
VTAWLYNWTFLPEIWDPEIKFKPLAEWAKDLGNLAFAMLSFFLQLQIALCK